MSAFVRCCLQCGRWGIRAFRPADDGAEGWVCVNDRACQRRSPNDIVTTEMILGWEPHRPELGANEGEADE